MIRSLFLFIVAGPLLSFANGGVVGNGGDSVFCKSDSGNSLGGTYSLDYILGLWQTETNPGYLAEDIFSDSNSYTNNFKRLMPILRESYPLLADSMTQFYSQLFSQDFDKNFVWKPASNGLVDLKDEAMISLLPKNCLGLGQNPSLIQTVIRQKRGKQIIFNYDQNAVKALSLKPMQLSFLLFHEWLWSFTSDVSLIRDANLIFHAKNWSIRTADQQVNTLKKLGLFNIIVERIVRTKFLFENGKLRVFYQGQEVIPTGSNFNIHESPNIGAPIYQFLSSEQYYLGIYRPGNDLIYEKPDIALSWGEETRDYKNPHPTSYKVVLKKRLSLDPPQVYNVRFISP